MEKYMALVQGHILSECEVYVYAGKSLNACDSD